MRLSSLNSFNGFRHANDVGTQAWHRTRRLKGKINQFYSRPYSHKFWQLLSHKIGYDPIDLNHQIKRTCFHLNSHRRKEYYILNFSKQNLCYPSNSKRLPEPTNQKSKSPTSRNTSSITIYPHSFGSNLEFYLSPWTYFPWVSCKWNIRWSALLK